MSVGWWVGRWVGLSVGAGDLVVAVHNFGHWALWQTNNRANVWNYFQSAHVIGFCVEVVRVVVHGVHVAAVDDECSVAWHWCWMFGMVLVINWELMSLI